MGAGITDVPGVEVFGKGRGQYELPCGFVDANGKVHKKITFRELTGHEEDMMDDDSVPRQERMSNVLCSCIERIGDVVDKDQIRAIVSDEMTAGKPMTSTDRIAAMIFLRRTSCGDIYKFERRCPRCGHINKNRTLDLRTIKMTSVPEERVAKRRVEVALPRSGQKVILRVMTAKNEAALMSLKLTKDFRTAAMAARVESVDGQKLDNPRATMEVLKSLPQADREYIRAVYDKMEADVDTSVEVTCDSPLCGAEYSFPLELGQTFFSNPAAVGVSEKELRWL